MAIVEVATGANGQDWGLLPKSAYSTAEGSSATDSLERGCNGWKALVIVAREGRSNRPHGFVQLRTCSRVGRGCYTTKKKCSFRQLSHLDERQFVAICHLPSAISNLKSQIVLGFHLRPEAF
ncbi:hypothetical protein [Microcoleus sp. OTE_8_concoct_300]|uniref:hypothetical protein n=1 Tax=Microcoleus sp. OTE_8_concoct_300 TaxID=2964710 RepID=UPI00403F102C